MDINDNIKDMSRYTDLYPWYWLAYGEKCYAFAVVEAFPLKDGNPYPKPGTQLEPHETDINIWIGENGVEMMIDSGIAEIERQNGDTICSFIAAAHAKLMAEHLPKI